MNALILCLMLMQTVDNNPSLFSESAPNLFLFRDLKARNVGDIVTIQIVENATATNTATTSTKKAGDGSLSAPALGGLQKTASALTNLLSATGSLNFNGTGSTTRSGQLQAEISARVVEVLPNGDLRIEGTKEVTINREKQVISIGGIVRGHDVTPSNIISSTSIANMDVRFNGKGVVADANNQGWLYKLMKLITPF